MVLACVAGVKRGRGRGEFRRAPPSRVVSRPNSLSLPFRTPATQMIPKYVFFYFSYTVGFKEWTK